MVINITDESIFLRRRYGISIDMLRLFIEAHIYFNNEYKEHLIEDEFGTQLPYYNVDLLDFRTLYEYISYYISADGSGVEDLEKDAHIILDTLDNLFKILKRSLHYDCVYVVDIKVIGKGTCILYMRNKGCVLELRYLDLLRLKSRIIKWSDEYE